MELSKDFEMYVFEVIKECERIVAAYPFSMQKAANKYMKKLHFVSDGDRKAGFSYLMPYWFKDSFGLELDTCHTIALGNCFALLYFMSQDEIYDEKENADISLLPVSNLFYLNFAACYRKAFNSESIFWTYFEKYIREWTESILWEKEHHHGQAVTYSDEDFIRLSRKAAPLKIPYTAVCILAGKCDYIENFEIMVDYDQAAFQMIDDWRDWKYDLSNHNFTYLLTESIKYNNLESPDLLEESHVRKAVFVGDILEKVMDKAKYYVIAARESIGNIDVPYISLYLDEEMNICNSIIKKAKEDNAIMMSGGLNTLLSRLTSK